jgi:hypothetical protein
MATDENKATVRGASHLASVVTPSPINDPTIEALLVGFLLIVTARAMTRLNGGAAGRHCEETSHAKD